MAGCVGGVGGGRLGGREGHCLDGLALPSGCGVVGGDEGDVGVGRDQQRDVEQLHSEK